MAPSPQLSILLSNPGDSIRTRKVAILAADGCDDGDLNAAIMALSAAGAQAKVVAPHLGYLTTSEGNTVKIHCSLLTASSVLCLQRLLFCLFRSDQAVAAHSGLESRFLRLDEELAGHACVPDAKRAICQDH